MKTFTFISICDLFQSWNHKKLTLNAHQWVATEVIFLRSTMMTACQRCCESVDMRHHTRNFIFLDFRTPSTMPQLRVHRVCHCIFVMSSSEEYTWHSTAAFMTYFVTGHRVLHCLSMLSWQITSIFGMTTLLSLMNSLLEDVRWWIILFPLPDWPLSALPSLWRARLFIFTLVLFPSLWNIPEFFIFLFIYILLTGDLSDATTLGIPGSLFTLFSHPILLSGRKALNINLDLDAFVTSLTSLFMAWITPTMMMMTAVPLMKTSSLRSQIPLRTLWWEMILNLIQTVICLHTVMTFTSIISFKGRVLPCMMTPWQLLKWKFRTCQFLVLQLFQTLLNRLRLETWEKASWMNLILSR